MVSGTNGHRHTTSKFSSLLYYRLSPHHNRNGSQQEHRDPYRPYQEHLRHNTAHPGTNRKKQNDPEEMACFDQRRPVLIPEIVRQTLRSASTLAPDTIKNQ